MREASLFAQRIKSQTGKYIILVKGARDGKKCWYYVLSDKVKMPVLLKKCAVKTTNLNLEDYGRILKSGWGEEPPVYITDKIEREGADYDNSEFDIPAGREDMEFYVESTDKFNNRKFFVRLNVAAHLTVEFEKVVNYGACDIGAYGTVIESGWL